MTRSMRFALPLGLLLSSCTMSSLAPPPPASAWPEFRGSASAQGRTRQAQPVRQPELVWSFDTGGTVESSPTVIDGRLLVGTFANNLFCLDAGSGEELWRFPVEGLLRCSPSVRDGKVYFGADDNFFYCLEAASGNELWRFEVGDGGEQSSPLLVGDLVVFGGFDYQVYGLDAATGSPRWQTPTQGEILSSPRGTQERVYVGSRDGRLYAIDPSSGEMAWTFKPGTRFGAPHPCTIKPCSSVPTTATCTP